MYVATNLAFAFCHYKIHIFHIIIFSVLFLSLYCVAQCKHPLGMESGAIADFQITASTAHDMGNVGPQHAR